MAIAFRAAPEVGATDTRNKPAGTATGDVLLMAVHATHGSAAAVTGFTVVASHTLAGAFTLTVLRRTADGSEGSTFTATGGSILRTAIVGLTGADGGAPIDGTPTTAQGTGGASVVLGAVTTTSANSLLMAFVGAAHGTNVTGIGTPVSMTEQFEDGTGGASAMVFSTEVRASSGSTGTRTFTHSYSGSSGHAYGVMLAVKESAAGGVSVSPSLLSGDTSAQVTPVTVTTGNRSIITALPSLAHDVLAATAFERVHVTVSAPLAGNDTYGVLPAMVVGGVTVAAGVVTGETSHVLAVGSVGVGVQVSVAALNGEYYDLFAPDILGGATSLVGVAGSIQHAVYPATAGELAARQPFSGTVRTTESVSPLRGVATDHTGPRARTSDTPPPIRGRTP